MKAFFSKQLDNIKEILKSTTTTLYNANVYVYNKCKVWAFVAFCVMFVLGAIFVVPGNEVPRWLAYIWMLGGGVFIAFGLWAGFIHLMLRVLGIKKPKDIWQ